MPGIYAIPTTRITDLFISRRLVSQTQSDQYALSRIHDQISTGRRIAAPSEDAPAAIRAIDLQRLLERKDQVRINLATNQSFLSATDSSLSEVSRLIAEARATAIGATGDTSTAAERDAAVEQIRRTIEQLADVGNTVFRGRHLFAGSRTTVAPFERLNGFVKYQGDDRELRSYSDIDLLFGTNVSGDAVFGAFSQEVEGTADLNPILTAQTRVTQLREGEGINLGSIEVQDGSSSRVIDLSGAASIGDIVARLEADPGAGPLLKVTLTSSGLNVELDPPAGTLEIREVAVGTTARELGILREVGAGPGPIVGQDLDPVLVGTTPLANILGVRATAVVSPAGGDNDLIFEAALRGTAFNDVTIEFVAGAAGSAGAETVVYDDTNPLDKRLTITIESGVSRADQVIQAVNAEGTFTARLDPHETDNDGDGPIAATVVDPAATGATTGGGGIEFDKTSGVQVVNGGQTHVISLATAETIEDVLNAFNGSAADVHARINADGTGLDIVSRLSGGDFSVGENGGTTATELGIRSFTAATRLSGLNYGRGVGDVAGADFTITRRDGVQFSIDVAGAQDVQDILDRINTDATNLASGVPVVARLAAFGNGIELEHDDLGSPGPLTVARTNAGPAALDLGLVTADQPTASSSTTILTGSDPNPIETRGVFNALIRLEQAIAANDTDAIERGVALLDASVLDLNLERAELGARQQSLDTLELRLDAEEIELRRSLSNDIDVDLVEAISDLADRQASFEASLQSSAALFRLTLLDFL